MLQIIMCVEPFLNICSKYAQFLLCASDAVGNQNILQTLQRQAASAWVAVGRLHHTTKVAGGGAASIRAIVRVFISLSSAARQKTLRHGVLVCRRSSLIHTPSTCPQRLDSGSVHSCSLAVIIVSSRRVSRRQWKCLTFALAYHFLCNTAVTQRSYTSSCLDCHRCMLAVLYGEANLTDARFLCSLYNRCSLLRNGAKASVKASSFIW